MQVNDLIYYEICLLDLHADTSSHRILDAILATSPRSMCAREYVRGTGIRGKPRIVHAYMYPVPDGIDTVTYL